MRTGDSTAAYLGNINLITRGIFATQYVRWNNGRETPSTHCAQGEILNKFPSFHYFKVILVACACAFNASSVAKKQCS